MVGLSQAIALADAGIEVTVIDREDPKTILNTKFDGRTSAIAWKSYKFLDKIGAWAEMARHGQPINDIRVSDNKSPLFVHFDHSDVGDDPFGYIIENRHIRAALYKRAKQLKSLKLLAPAEITNLDLENSAISLKSGDIIKYQLLIGADGKNSFVRKTAGISEFRKSYGQMGIVCTIEHELPHNGLAHEKFLPAGPFAVLPMQGNRSSLVWTEPSELAPIYMQMADTEFLAEIEKRCGYLGKLKLVEGRWCYPLELMHSDKYIKDNMLLIGDAAHSIHPIAGQGVNLGFRDAELLTDMITENMKLGLGAASGKMLEGYENIRKLDNRMMIFATDTLNRLFSNSILPIKLARSWGLGIVNEIPPLKRFFMRQASGKT